MKIDLAIIGGTGLYQWEELESVEPVTVNTAYGEPSASIMLGQWKQKQLAFLPRHGQTHTIPPHAINYRANLSALKQLGVKQIVAVNAVGGIHKEMLEPGMLAIPDQVIDYSHGRISSFFHEKGDAMKHIDFTSPYCEILRTKVIKASVEAELPCQPWGTYGCTQGPRLEARAEITRLERDGCDLVGMTGMPETALAKEIDLAYTSICIVVNPAAGKSQQLITMDDIELAMKKGLHRVKQVIARLLEQM